MDALLASSVKLPPDLDLQGANAATKFPAWLDAFEDYLIAIGHDESHDKVKLSLLRNIMGEEARSVLSTIPMTGEERKSYENVTKRLGEYVKPRTNECYERYLFMDRKQNEGETFGQFMTACRKLIKSCNYNDTTDEETVEEKILRDKIVHGIRDKVIREGLLRVDNLTLRKAETYCRATEQSRQQANKMEEIGDTAGTVVDAVKTRHRQSNSKPQAQSLTLLVALYDKQGYCWCILHPHQQG
ncbi:uncharacterized protein LOC124155265 [Ischnura elegans]|uniref:uncharacterized protein LOC124155265 n=1 Tax=Ischnura elegans TaxID=197161 RepID=UPI001ED8AB8A|nr:uncharacterized protein LOC124155265 [Ischnura elegans]